MGTVHLAILRQRTIYSAISIIAIVLSACGEGGGSAGSTPDAPTTYTASSGVAQKGPLILGSTVTAQELNASLSPTGQQYSYQITSNLGTFSPTSVFGSEYVGVNANGYYFDEVQSTVSSGQITLNGYSDLSVDGVLNVNLLTTLEYQRIGNLVAKSGMTFATARTQAEGEVLAAFHVPPGSYGSFDTLDISKGNSGDQILTAISSLFVYGNTSGNLALLIANVQNDIGTNGAITNPATAATLVASGKALSPTTIAANLTKEYASEGVSFTAGAISAWIDQDGDGVLGQFKFQVADATQTSSFTFPSSATDPYAGTAISVSIGQLSVNGAPTGPTTTKAGDLVAVSPPTGTFPNGILTTYLLSGATKIARVSYTSGLASITVTPAAGSRPVGLPQQFTAMGTFSDGSTANLTGSATWASGTATVGTINVASGLATAVAVGETSIVATVGSLSGDTTFSVTAAVLQSVAITPSPFATGIGIARKMTAAGIYSDGTSIDVTSTALWTTSSLSVATVTGGIVTGVALGSTTVSATTGSLVGTGVLNVTTGTWNAAASMAVAQKGQSSTLLQNGQVLMTGGTDAEIYDPIADSWRTVASVPLVATGGNSAILLADGRVIFIGSGACNGGSIYNPAANSWTVTANMSVARCNATANLLSNGKIVVAGGTSLSTPLTYLTTTEIYDPVANEWTTAASMNVARSGHTATTLSNATVLVTGGQTNGALQTNLTASAEIYDPLANTWTLVPSMSAQRENDTATLLTDGTVLVVGGDNGFTYYPLGTSEVFDSIANTWATPVNLKAGADGATATLLPSGKVLVAGGICMEEGICSTAALYDSVARSWALTGSMSVSRLDHAAILLPSGAVLVTGGETQAPSANSTASAELYW